MKKIYRALMVLHILVGVGAMSGGLAAITSPEKPLGMSVDALKNGPFKDFLIPGLFLFIVIGLGNVISGILFRYKLNIQGYISSAFGFVLMLWIVIQCIILGAVVFLHVLFFIIGLIQAVLAISILFKKRQFPTNIVLNFINK